jgi:dolichol-phosphate mannosyltransferase
LRYLLRNQRIFEVPIHYNAPSPSVSKGALTNSLETLLYYFGRRLVGKAPKV